MTGISQHRVTAPALFTAQSLLSFGDPAGEGEEPPAELAHDHDIWRYSNGAHG